MGKRYLFFKLQTAQIEIIILFYIINHKAEKKTDFNTLKIIYKTQCYIILPVKTESKPSRSAYLPDRTDVCSL